MWQELSSRIFPSFPFFFSGCVHAGGDWQSASDGRIDLHGHGTHLAAILAGAKDGVGMHAVCRAIDLGIAVETLQAAS